MASFRGTTADCAQDFGRRYSISGGLGLMAETTGVVGPTALGWVLGDGMPTGDTLLKLRCFLSLVGYQVEEFIELPKPTKRFAELIMLGVIDVEEARSILGYVKIQDLYRVLLRGQGLHADKAHRLQRFVDEHAQQREDLVNELKSNFTRLSLKGESVEERDAEAEVSEHQEAPEVVPDPEIGAPLAVNLLLHDLHAVVKLLEVIGSADEGWSERARALLTNQLTDAEIDYLRRWLAKP